MPSEDTEIVTNLDRKSLIVLIITLGLAFFTLTTYVNAMITFRPSTISQYEPSPPPTPQNQRPVAEAGPDQRTSVNENVYFDGSGSSDPDGSIENYNWRFGDGASASGINVSHIYSSEGVYIVTLTVIDDEGATASDTRRITIEGPIPRLRDVTVISAVVVAFFVIFIIGIFLRWWY